MILLAHIIIATSSILASAYVFISPSKNNLFANYALVALTFISGFILLWGKPVHLAQVCTTGLVYLGIVSAGIVSGHRKLKNLNARHSLV